MTKYNFNIGTKLQHLVWNRIAKIPKGKILTYKELANEIGYPNSVRAVASALNPDSRLVIKDVHVFE